MLKQLKDNNAGFTLIELLLALALIVMMIGFSIVTLSAVPKARMRGHAETIKSEFELTREFAKSHGGQAIFKIQKTQDGIDVIRVGKDLKRETKVLKDRALQLHYTITGDTTVYTLGKSDHFNVVDSTLQMTFAQTTGEMIGPDMVDTIIISNDSKNYTFHIKHETGMIYYDYELEDMNIDENKVNNNTQYVESPSFLKDGKTMHTVTLKHTGTSIQPDIKYDSRNIKIGGVYRAIEPGEYRIIFKLKNPYHTTWDTGGTTDKVLQWKIEP